jgi:hypothetical protein
MFDIPRAEKLDRTLNKGFNEIRYMRRKMEEKEFLQIRASSFPICPRAYVIYRRLPVRKRPAREESFISEAATLMGSALHLALQKWFGIQGSLYGNWVCVRCKKIRRHATGTQTCKSCGREMTYHEYAIPRTKTIPFTGHIDGILKTHAAPVLIDFKGSSVPAIRELKQANQPKESHYLQVNAYANVVNLHLERFGLDEKIQKIIIIYVDRGKPWQTWLPLQVPVSQRIYRETLGRVQLAQECLQTGKIPKGLCAAPTDSYAKYCPWRTTCFSPAIEGLLHRELQPEGKREDVSEQDLFVLASFFENN